ncbi:MAG: ROK family protein, partial [Promicromonosporaceae bacterium]|nr:ROK family protein [Promicromonosporaceae bacterium]
MHAIGIDIGGTKIAIGVVDETGRIVAQQRRETNPDNPQSINRVIADACNELAIGHEVGAIGVAAAGFVSADRSTVAFAANLAWRDYPLAAELARLIDVDVPIVVENDANAAGWAEFRFGAGREATDMLMLTIGTGLGGALIIGRELVRGRWGLAAEVGHMRMVPGGQYCGCGHEGCWEQYASGSALTKHARRAVVARPDRAEAIIAQAGGVGEKIKGPHVTAAAEAGDPLAREIFAELGHWIGHGAASVAALLDPEIIVVGGGVAEVGDLIMGAAREGFKDRLSALGHRP